MLKRLKIWQKITLIAVSFTVPLVVLLYFLISLQSVQIDFATAELRGTEYLRPLRKLVVGIAEHRDLSARANAGDKSVEEALAKKAAEIEANWDAVAAVDAKFGSVFLSTDLMNATRKYWKDEVLPNARKDWEVSFKKHGTLIRNLHNLSYQVGNSSNLILDPEVESHFCMDAIIFKVPKLTEEISQARAYGYALLATGGGGDANVTRRQLLAALTIRADDAFTATKQFVQYAFNDPKISSKLGPRLDALEKSVTSFLSDLNTQVVNATTPMSLADFAESAQKVFDEKDAYWNASVEALDSWLQQRISNFQRDRLTALAVAGASLLLTILLIVFIVRAITTPITYLARVADRISLGEMEEEIRIDSKDEIGELGERFRRLQVSLKAAMEQLDRDAGGEL